MKKRKPIIVFLLIAINVLVFIVQEFMGDTTSSEFMYYHGAIYPDLIHYDNEYWRLITATFMHFGFEHLLNNMLLLGCAGVILEDALGHIKFLILYLFAGIGGSTLSYLQMLKSGNFAVSAGASGAIFGIVGGLLWVAIRNKGRYGNISPSGMIVMIVLMLAYGVTTSGIDNWGHIGGLITGIILCVLLYRKAPEEVDFKEDNQYTSCITEEEKDA